MRRLTSGGLGNASRKRLRDWSHRLPSISTSCVSAKWRRLTALQGAACACCGGFSGTNQHINISWMMLPKQKTTQGKFLWILPSPMYCARRTPLFTLSGGGYSCHLLKLKLVKGGKPSPSGTQPVARDWLPFRVNQKTPCNRKCRPTNELQSHRNSTELNP